MGKALLVIDAQRDFCENGSLPVTGGNIVCESICSFVQSREHEYDEIVFTLDWHEDPGSHWIREGEEPNYSTTWPIHCRAGTEGAMLNVVFLDRLPGRTVYFKKGQYQAAYSGFEGTHWMINTPLREWLRLKGIQELDICGIATDYCVKATVLDALDYKFDVHVIADFIAAVDPIFSGPQALDQMVNNGAKLIESQSI